MLVASLEPIARLLAERQALPGALLKRAQSESPTKSAFLDAVLELGVPETDLVSMMSEQLGIPGVDLARTAIDLSILDSVPRPVAESDIVLPLSIEGGRLHVAVSAGADNYDVLEELRFITGQEVSHYAALPGTLPQETAVEKLNSEKYDLILLDAMLPHVHGFEICARLKASVRTRSTPVILVSAVYRGWRYAHDARETFGADDYLEKPFHLPELLRRVEERLSGGANSAASSAKGDKLYQEGIDLLEQKKPAEARAVLEKAIKEEPFSPRAHFALARAMHDQGEIFHAITAYERAVELRPNLFQALRALAGLYEQKGFRRKAAEALERAVHTAPDPQTRDAMRQRLLRLL